MPASEGKRNSGGGSGSEVDIDALRVSQCIKNLIRGVEDESHPYESRSEEVFAVLIAMAAEGHTDEEMAAVMAGEIGQHIRDQSNPNKYLARQIAKAREAAADKDIARLNENHALVIVGDKTAILKEQPDGGVMFLSHVGFDNWLKNRHVVRDGKQISLAKYWLSHSQRRQYEGLVFAPGRDVPGHYNLWKGFSVKPQPGDCSKFLAHIKENVCLNDSELFGWVIGWFAHMVQKPDEKIGTALVLRGKQGTGKTIIGKVIRSLLGSHYTAVADPRYITGRFNSHLASCLLLHADEGFWAGDHAAEGKLKDLVTGDQHLIEYKGKEPIKVKNYTRLFVTGNPHWLVPAGYEERRFAVLDVGEDHMQDHAYFQAIDEEMNNGGREALLDYLLRFDLGKVNLRTIPKTSALLDQKVESLSGEQSWWLDMLTNGVLPRGCESGKNCPVRTLHNSYIEHAGRTGIRRRASETQIGTFLHRHTPGLRRHRVSCSIRRPGSGVATPTRDYAYEFPPLAECRAAFENLIQQKIDWPEQRDWLVEGRASVDDEFAAPHDTEGLFKFPGAPHTPTRGAPYPDWLN